MAQRSMNRYARIQGRGAQGEGTLGEEMDREAGNERRGRWSSRSPLSGPGRHADARKHCIDTSGLALDSSGPSSPTCGYDLPSSKLDTLLSDPSLHFLTSPSRNRYMAPSLQLAPSPTRSTAPVSTSTPLYPEDATPTDLLLATPPSILKLLTVAAPMIHALETFIQLVTWTHPSFFSSLLVLVGWWGVCLFGHLVARYGAPLAVLLYILTQYLKSAPGRAVPAHRHLSRPATLTPSSYTALLTAAQSLGTNVYSLRSGVVYPIASRLSFVPTQAGRAAPAYVTAWITITSYPFYLALTYAVPMNYILLVLGSVGLLWNAPFFRTLRVVLWKSAFVRWSCRIVLGILSGGRGLKKELSRTKSGLGVPGLLGKVAKGAEVKDVAVKSPAAQVGEKQEEGEDVKLVFTVFENQRWWVGLDWTHALLPGERASWYVPSTLLIALHSLCGVNRTDPALNASSPPSSFQLPPPSIIYTPSPIKSDPTSRLKRTTEWKWLDAEWKVMRSTSPSLPTPVSSPSLLSSSPATSFPFDVASSGLAVTPHAEAALFATWNVDDEGWQYGDNHFERMGSKGGLGKYTRRRAWYRSAGLVERCERVSGEEEGKTAGKEVARGSLRESRREKEEGEGKEVRRRKSSGARRESTS
jgi:hypothetical protein